MGAEERPDLVTSAISSEAVAHTLVTPHTTGVLVTPTMPLEAVGVPITSEVFRGYHAVPQQAINTTALHQLSAFPPEMPEGTTVSFIPQPSMAVGEAGHMDPHQVALGTAYMTAQLGQVRGEVDQVVGEGSQTSMEHIPLTGSAPMCVPTPMSLTQGATQTMTSDMHPEMSMSGTALTLPPGVMLAMPASSVQRNKMDLNALKEQLQKLVPGAHLTLTHHPTEGNVNSGSPSLDGLPPVYPQAPLSAAQTAMGGIPLTVVGSSAMTHQEGLAATSEAGVILPQTVRLPGGETVAFVGPVMMEPGCQPPLGYPTMLPLGMEKDRGTPLQPGPPLSRTPSLKESEEQGEKLGRPGLHASKSPRWQRRLSEEPQTLPPPAVQSAPL
ncbi:uncharacterized protein LOC123504278 [Portunus trituberculatus]|uniref:uncharacterized protein LOC123504278 n=1 Tax=Portunus trituberculatus TaxID=210409 RepID=UPI001E1CBBD2|nr:uncharacterized protein LOC123504278 [Portunus trituberculatus]